MSMEHVQGFIKITDAQTGELAYQAKNVIVQGTKFLFSRIFATLGNTAADTPHWGVWGLALGKGDPMWSPTKEYDASVTQWKMEQELLRKQISKAQYVKKVNNPDGTFDLVPTGSINSGLVEFQTPLNATTDKGLIASGEVQAIREMGLIGGGINVTDPLKAPMWSPEHNVSDTMTLINYKTLLPLILPKDVTFLISWTLVF